MKFMIMIKYKDIFRNKRFLIYLLMVFSVSFFIFFRTNHFTGGDSEQWEREIYNGEYFRKRQMLSFFFMQLIYQIFSRLFFRNAFLSIQLYSILCGILSLILVYHLFKQYKNTAIAILIVFTSGFTAIFYGHIETYALPITAFLFLIYSVHKYLKGEGKAWLVFAAFSFFAWTHLVAFFLFPFMIFFFIMEHKRVRFDGDNLRKIFIACLPVMLLWYLIKYRGIGTGELAGEHFVHFFNRHSNHYFAQFDISHIQLKSWFMWFNSGIQGFIAILVILSQVKRDIFMRYLSGMFLCMLIFLWIWHPDAGMKDWDLFSFPSVIASVIVAYYFCNKTLRRSPDIILLILIIGLNAGFLFPRLVRDADIGKRGHGYLSFENIPENWMLVIDYRLFLKEKMNCITIGQHKLTVRIPDQKKSYDMEFIMKKGKRYTLNKAEIIEVINQPGEDKLRLLFNKKYP